MTPPGSIVDPLPDPAHAARTTLADPRPTIGVVVPVHDEEHSLGRCLDALGAAVRTVQRRARVCVVTVIDACTDRSARIARNRRVAVVASVAGNVGRARATGCSALLARAGGSVTWLATTDADSEVDARWLAGHLDALDDGWDALVGTVTVREWGSHTPRARHRHAAAYYARRLDDASAHDHVHGANLGIRASAYRAVGGFRALASGEDVALVADLDRAGHQVRRTWQTPVVTSARVVGRAPAGFAADLLRLDVAPADGEVPVTGRPA